MNPSTLHPEYHIVNIQNLEDKNPDLVHVFNEKNQERLLSRELIARREEYQKAHVYYQNSNCDNFIRIPTGSGFFHAFLTAYNYHRDIILSPDDVWNQIMIVFSRYVQNHAEELRSKF